jgi:hypothetical protein
LIGNSREIQTVTFAQSERRGRAGTGGHQVKETSEREIPSKSRALRKWNTGKDVRAKVRRMPTHSQKPSQEMLY